MYIFWVFILKFQTQDIQTLFYVNSYSTVDGTSRPIFDTIPLYQNRLSRFTMKNLKLIEVWPLKFWNLIFRAYNVNPK